MYICPFLISGYSELEMNILNGDLADTERDIIIEKPKDLGIFVYQHWVIVGISLRIKNKKSFLNTDNFMYSATHTRAKKQYGRMEQRRVDG